MSARPDPDWDTVKRLFHDASALDGADRHAFLTRACASDPDLRHEVESLLDVQTIDFLETPALAVEAEDAAPRTIGPYHTISELGRGGMGKVYLAVRADDAYQKRVAVKLVKRGTDTDEIVQRFRLERQTLARLDHPNIARIVDGGTTSDGRPYFVMDYVDGVPIDVFCDSARMSVEARLDLFRVVCHSVQYAHQNLVIHRDIKPANIMVTRDGQPKLLDFGVAKVLTGDVHEDSSQMTRLPDRRITLSHASPEQVRDQVVTTSTDIYSLGVLLYQLLCGAKPYETAGVSNEAAVRAICEIDPEPPSERIKPRGRERRDADHQQWVEEAAANRGTSPTTLAWQLRGDLDRIVLTALRKEPARRYVSVQQFSEDIQRHLRGLPVQARGDSIGYRASTFVRRHPLGMTAVSVAAIALILGSAATLWQASEAAEKARLADRRFQDVRQLANAFIFEVHDAIANLPGSTAARELLVRRALSYVDSLAAESTADTQLQLELASAYERIGDVQGNPTNANLGDIPAARASYEKALAVAGRVAAADNSSAVRRLRARLMQRTADLLAFSGQTPEAVTMMRQAGELYAAEMAGAPGDSLTRLASAVSSIKLGDVLGNPDFPNTGDADGARREYERALPLIEGLPNEQSEARLRYLGLIHERLGRMREAAGSYAEALDHYRASLDHRLAFAAQHAADADGQRNVGIAHEKIAGVLAASGDATGALASYRTALAQYQLLHEADPANAQATRTLLIGHEHVGDALAASGEIRPALDAYTAAVGLATTLLRRAPGNVQVLEDRARLYLDLARTAAGTTPEQSCEWAERSVQDQRRLTSLGRHATALVADDARRLVAACRSAG
ncbi:MAG: protein kinase [Acidobacteria bacterium]|nr:protein kinase [Acidobacteriota bacterium]